MDVTKMRSSWSPAGPNPMHLASLDDGRLAQGEDNHPVNGACALCALSPQPQDCQNILSA